MADAKEVVRQHAIDLIQRENNFGSDSLEARLIYHVADCLRRVDLGEINYAYLDSELQSVKAQLRRLKELQDSKSATMLVHEFITDLQRHNTHPEMRADLLGRTIERQMGRIDDDMLLTILERARMTYLQSMENLY